MIEIKIRKASMNDFATAKEIYELGRRYMRQNGNPTQWHDGYPQDNVIEADISAGNLYVCDWESKSVGIFAFIIGEDPTYRVIEDGAWRCNEPYGTIHRVASSGTIGGVTKAVFDYCKTKINYLRIDTHRDNKPMQNAVTRYGFTYRGIIHIADGSERLAYDYKE